jgi:hypothetical protein
MIIPVGQPSAQELVLLLKQNGKLIVSRLFGSLCADAEKRRRRVLIISERIYCFT